MLLSFGDVFRYQEEEYVYLIEGDGITYAAKIYSDEITRRLVCGREHAAKLGGDDKPMYSFVLLTISAYSGRAAGLGLSGQNNIVDDYPEKITSLPNADLKAIKDEIKDSRAVPIAVRDFVNTLPEN